MSRLVFTLAVCVVGIVCSCSGCIHWANYRQLRSHLMSHMVLAPHLVALGAFTTIAVELSIGVLTTLFAIGATSNLLLPRCAMVAALLLFIGFAAYLQIVRRRVGDGRVSCGCGVGESVITRESVTRAGTLSAIAGLAVIGLLGQATSPDLVSDGPLFAFLVVSASLTTVIFVLWLPVTLQQDRLLVDAIA